jgi:hypothetical protein
MSTIHSLLEIARKRTAGIKTKNPKADARAALVTDVSDSNTQSTKAQEARSYGTRIIAEPVFWKSTGVAVD